MKITFLDTIPFSYDIDHPLHHPLGAGNSAICYLSKELQFRGHHVTVYNGSKEPSDLHGVAVRNHGNISPHALNSQDVVVVCSGAVGSRLRNEGVTVPLVLWTQHAHDQPAVQLLRSPAERYAWNAVAYVSQWQRKHYEGFFGVPPDKAKIIPNGIARPFEVVERRTPFYYEDRPPVLAYTSTPFRGLMTLLSAWPRISEAIPGIHLNIFSSMKVYQKSQDDDDFGYLYLADRVYPDITYIGSLGQRDLARALAYCDVLAYPSTFAEGQCVAIAEAMAAGCAVFTTSMGALPEVYGGYATMTEWQGDGLVRRYADDVIAGIKAMQEDPIKALADRKKRIDFINENFLWHNLAKEWEAFLTRLSMPNGSVKIAS